MAAKASHAAASRRAQNPVADRRRPSQAMTARHVRGERAELKTTAARASRSAGTAAGRLASVSTPGSDGRNAAHSPPSVPPITSSPTVTLPRVRGLMAQVRRRIAPGRYAAAGAGQPRDTQPAAAELAAWVPGRSVDLCLCKTPGQDRLAALLLLARCVTGDNHCPISTRPSC